MSPGKTLKRKRSGSSSRPAPAAVAKAGPSKGGSKSAGGDRPPASGGGTLRPAYAHLMVICAIILLGTALYANFLSAPFLFDDTHNILESTWIKSPQKFFNHYFKTAGFYKHRIIPFYTFAVNWQLGEDGWAYSVEGADQIEVVDGDVNSWSWGAGDAPVLISFQNICEGLPFIMPEATQTSIPPTDTPQPTQVDTAEPTMVSIQPTPTAEGSQTGVGTYIVYASIIVVLGALIFVLFRSRKKE